MQQQFSNSTLNTIYKPNICWDLRNRLNVNQLLNPIDEVNCQIIDDQTVLYSEGSFNINGAGSAEFAFWIAFK